jgi:hypothetical protein
MERRRNGQCFKCKGPFSKTHQCPEKHLRVIIVDDDVAEGDEGRLLAVEVETDEEGVEGEMSMMSFFQLGQESQLKP